MNWAKRRITSQSVNAVRPSVLVLATDGFFEWENAQGEQFGVARLEATIRASRERPASEIIATLYSAVIAFSQGTPQKDDLTAIIIKRT